MRKKMILRFFPVLALILSLVAVTLFPLTAYAHPPKDVELTYDMTKKSLRVTIVHPSFFTSLHYINLVAVKKNGPELNTYNHQYQYQSQPDKNTFSYTYEIPASLGDTFEVTAKCNIFGSKSAKLTISDITQEASPSAPGK